MLDDPNGIARLFPNLIDNAARYANQSVVVSCWLDDTTGAAIVTVEDDGPGIPESQRNVVFERFTRLDPSRTRSTGGSGLGLAIANAIVDAHKGTILIEDFPQGGARVEVHLQAHTV